MRHRIVVIGTSETARAVALLLVARDDCHLLLTGEDGAALQAAAVALAAEPRVDGPVPAHELTAADVVVVCEGQAPPAEDLRIRCPDTVLIVATADVAADARALQDELRWPRQRVLGIGAGAATGPATRRAAAAVQLIDHVIADRDRTVEVTVQTTAQGGEGSWGSVPARIGARGIQAFDEG